MEKRVILILWYDDGIHYTGPFRDIEEAAYYKETKAKRAKQHEIVTLEHPMWMP